jgi:hypothetical protein
VELPTRGSRSFAHFCGSESPLDVPPELLRQADALFAVLTANPELLEVGRSYGLRLGMSPLLAVLLVAVAKLTLCGTRRRE